MQARVNVHMPFAGKIRKPGEIIPSDEWMAVEDAPRRAVVSQGMVTLMGDDGVMQGEAGATPLSARLDALEATQERILELLETAAQPKAKPKRVRKRA